MAKDLTGTTLGKYQIMERLGRGGMADVYRAYQPGMDRYIAIKVMHSHLATDPSFITRFKREAQSVGNLRHSNIVQVIDFDVQDDEYYMVMEYIQGDTLKAMLQRRGALPISEALDITSKLADALAYAHSEGMIHRDIKPANILFTKSGSPILTDFGIARIMDASGLTMSGAFVGTPSYISPEAGRGETVDARADIYSLGIVLYEMLTGKVPYDADTPYAVVLKHINDPLPLPRQFVETLPESVERVVLKALAKDKADRFQTAAEFRQALEQAKTDSLKEMPTEIGAPAATARTSAPPVPADAGTVRLAARPAGRNRLPLIIGVVAVLILIVGAVALLTSRLTNELRPTLPILVASLTATNTTVAVVNTQTPPVSTVVVSATGAATSVAIVQGDPKYAELTNRVKLLLIEGSPEQALLVVEDALKADPQSYDLLALRGRVYVEGPTENRSKAEADAQAAIKLDANRPEAYIVLGNYYQFGKETDKSDEIVANLKQAITFYTQAIDRSTKDYYAYWGRALASTTLNGYVGSSNGVPMSAILRDFDTAAGFSPHDQRFYVDRARVYFDQRNYAQAQKDYEQAVALRAGSIWIYPYLAATYLLQDQKQKAYDLYAGPIEKDNNHDPDVLAAGAYLAWVNGKTDKANDWAKLALTLEPDTASALYMLALLDWDARKYDDALKKLDTLAKTPESWRYATSFLIRTFNRNLHADRARILAEMGKLDEAVSAYNQAQRDEPGWIALWVEQAQVYIKQGKKDDARKALQAALDYAIDQKDDKARAQILDLLKQVGVTEVATGEPTDVPIEVPTSEATAAP